MRPFLLTGMLLACCAQQRPSVLAGGDCASGGPSPSPSAAATPSTPAAQRFNQQGFAAPAFADPLRKEKLLAAVPKLDAHFGDFARNGRVPGLVVGLVIDGELAWTKGYGVGDQDSKVPTDADTVFRLASLTKTFTAAAVLRLRDEGKLSLDDPVDKYVPEASALVYPTHDSSRVSLRELLTHTAGLPHSAPRRDGESQPAADARLLDGLGSLLGDPPGVRWSYSNVGFSLLGVVVSRVSSMPYADFVTVRLLRPLGMTSTNFEPRTDKLASGYVRHGDANEHPPLERLGPSPYGGLFSSVRDLARYAAWQLSAWPPRDDADVGPLRRSSLREAQRMATFVSLWDPLPGARPSLAAPNASGSGFGWIVEANCELGSLVWHGGSLVDGYSSVVSLLPLRGVGIVALANLFDVDLGLAVRNGLYILGATGALVDRAPPSDKTGNGMGVSVGGPEGRACQ